MTATDEKLTRFAPAPVVHSVEAEEKPHKANYVGAPKIFLLEAACQQINDAFGSFGCYLVGSATQRPDWRDVDVRFIMEDARFAELFPRVGECNLVARWEFDPRWILVNTSIAEQLTRVTGLPIDFQITPQTFANKHHAGTRHALGIRMAAPEKRGSHERQGEARVRRERKV